MAETVATFHGRARLQQAAAYGRCCFRFCGGFWRSCAGEEIGSEKEIFERASDQKYVERISTDVETGGPKRGTKVPAQPLVAHRDVQSASCRTSGSPFLHRRGLCSCVVPSAHRDFHRPASTKQQLLTDEKAGLFRRRAAGAIPTLHINSITVGSAQLTMLIV